MAINTYPAVASPVKSIQRGSAGGAGTVTITSVDISKSMVNVQGSASSGTVAASGSINASQVVTAQGIAMQGFGYTGLNTIPLRNNGPYNSYFSTRLYLPPWTANMNATNLTGGSTNLVAAVVTGYLSNSTSLVVSGACRYEVVEFN